MFIELTISGEVIKQYHIPDAWLSDMDKYSKEENFRVRKKILSLCINQVKNENQLFLSKKDTGLHMTFRSKLDNISIAVTPYQWKSLVDEGIVDELTGRVIEMNLQKMMEIGI
jgi:hypothetical protein